MTPLDREELFELLLDTGRALFAVSGEIDTVVWLRAVVGFEGLMEGVKGVGSGRMVRLELAESLRFAITSVGGGPF